MAKEPDNLVLSLLREMRASVEGIQGDIKVLRERMDDLGDKMEVWQGTIASATGFAAHANTRSDKIERELAALRKRVEKLEKAR